MLKAGVSKIGWIGTGVMGKSMAGHIMRDGHSMIVFNRTASKADSLVANGAKFMTPVEIAKEADYLFLMLGYPHDVENMVLHRETGILKHMKRGAMLIDHTSSSPDLAERIADAASSHGVDSVDAPVTGGDIGAANGSLILMCGGTQEQVKRALPLLDLYSKEIAHMGGPGAG